MIKLRLDLGRGVSIAKYTVARQKGKEIPRPNERVP